MIEKHTGCNISKIVSLSRISKRYVESIALPTNGVINFTDIVITSGYDFELIPIVGNEGSFTQPPKVQNGNKYLEQNVKVSISKVEADTSRILNLWQEDSHILLVTVATGKTFLVGNIDTPAYFINAGANIPNTPGSLSSYSINFVSENIEFAPEVDLDN